MLVRVSYLELRTAPAAPAERAGAERIALEKLSRADYLRLYQDVGAPVRWDQRLQMPAPELERLLDSERLHLYLLRSGAGEAIGLCEFDRGEFPNIELKNFGVVPAAQGRGLGRWLLSVALSAEWSAGATRIWLHTDTWDHPAAIPLYQRVGFSVYAVRDEPADPL